MEVFYDCLPCTLRQIIEAARMTTTDITVQEDIINESLKILAHYQDYQSSPDLCRAMHSVVKRHTGISDPYKAIKEKDIETAKKVYPLLQEFIKNKGGGLYWVMRAAAAGNVLDSALYQNVDILSSLEEELEAPFAIADIEIFEDQLKNAKRLLLIGDNAGETVFDRLLLERFSDLDLTYAVRHAPIINDATIEDAYASGLGEYAKIISSGCDTPGTMIGESSEEFREAFYKADIVISKGQGNYEALSNYQRGVFFLFKAKCTMIAKKLDVHLNEYVFTYEKN